MKKKNKKKKGALANAAVDAALSQVESLRINNPSHLDRIVFCFPRILSNDDEWVDGSPLMAAAVVIARDPEKQVNKEIPLRYYEAGHKFPPLSFRSTA